MKTKKIGLVLKLDNNEPQFHSVHNKRKDAIFESEKLRQEGIFTQCYWLDYEENGIFVNRKADHFYCGNHVKYADINGFFFKLEGEKSIL